MSHLTVLVAVLCTTLALGQSAAQAGGGTGGGKLSGLRVTQVTYDTVSLSWDASSSRVLYYLLYRDGLWVNSSSGTSGNIGYLAAGSTHRVEVRARNSDNSLSEPAAVTVTTLADNGPPTAPQNLRVTADATGTSFGLAWDASTDDRGIRSYVLTADNTEAFNGDPGVSFYTLTDEYCTILHGQTYTFTVRAVDLSGNVSTTGTPVTVTVP